MMTETSHAGVATLYFPPPPSAAMALRISRSFRNAYSRHPRAEPGSYCPPRQYYSFSPMKRGFKCVQ